MTPQAVDWAMTWQMVAALGTVAAALATAFYAWRVWSTLDEMRLQRREMTRQVAAAEQQRLDTLRPQLVPFGHAGVVPLPHMQRGMDGVSPYLLHLRNIGAGPALDVTVWLGRHRGSQTETTLAHEFQCAVPDVGVAEEHPVTHTVSNEQLRPDHDCEIAIRYDDVHGRHFETSATLKGIGWVGVTTRLTEQRPPRFKDSAL